MTSLSCCSFLSCDVCIPDPSFSSSNKPFSFLLALNSSMFFGVLPSSPLLLKLSVYFSWKSLPLRLPSFLFPIVSSSFFDSIVRVFAFFSLSTRNASCEKLYFVLSPFHILFQNSLLLILETLSELSRNTCLVRQTTWYCKHHRNLWYPWRNK